MSAANVENQRKESRITRIWYEPSRNKYILAYSDEQNVRVADPEEVGGLRALAVHHKKAPPGALAAPLVAQIAVTSRCNLSCKFCYAAVKKQRLQDMRSDQIKQILHVLHANGTIYLEWSGGEPLLRSDFVELLQYAHELDFKQSVLTNGTLFDREFLDCASQCVGNIQVSVDDLEDHYNRLKGGAYWEVLAGNIQRAIAAGLPVTASITLSEHNDSRLDVIVEYLKDLGLQRARISWQIPMGEAASTTLEDYRVFVRNTVGKIGSIQKDNRRQGFHVLSLQELPMKETPEFLPREYLLCSAGRTRIHIDWNGDAFPCPVLKYPELCAGNMLDKSFERIWFSSAFDGIRSVRNGIVCRRCRLFCSYWCRALVYGFTRDIARTPSPLCPYASKGDVTTIRSGSRDKRAQACAGSPNVWSAFNETKFHRSLCTGGAVMGHHGAMGSGGLQEGGDEEKLSPLPGEIYRSCKETKGGKANEKDWDSFQSRYGIYGLL